MSKNILHFLRLIPVGIAGFAGVACGVYLGYSQGYKNGCADTILVHFDLERPRLPKTNRYHENKKILDMFNTPD